MSLTLPLSEDYTINSSYNIYGADDVSEEEASASLDRRYDAGEAVSDEEVVSDNKAAAASSLLFLVL